MEGDLHDPIENGDRPDQGGPTQFDENFVANAASAMGIYNITLEASNELQSALFFMLRNRIEKAIMFAAHSHRTRLLPSDLQSVQVLEKETVTFGTKTVIAAQESYDNNAEVELAQIVNMLPPKIAAEANIKAHWLAIDGEQPAVPENPVPTEDRICVVDDLNLSIDMEDSGRPSTKSRKMEEQSSAKTTTMHYLSLGQQVYFKEIMEAISGPDDETRNEALHAVLSDEGLQPLVARFCLSISEGIRYGIAARQLTTVRNLLRLLKSLLSNPALSLEKSLHELLPAVISCVISKQLCANIEKENHWSVREHAGKLLAQLSRRFDVCNVRPRVTRVLTDVYEDEAMSLCSTYGALYALEQFGLETVRSVVIASAAFISERLRVCEDWTAVERDAAVRLRALLLKLLTNHCRSLVTDNPNALSELRNSLGDFYNDISQALIRENIVPNVSRSQSGVSLKDGWRQEMQPAAAKSHFRPIYHSTSYQQPSDGASHSGGRRY